MKKAQFLFTNHLQIGCEYNRSISEFFDKFKYRLQPSGQSENYSLLPIFHLKLWSVACIMHNLRAGRNSNVGNASQQKTLLRYKFVNENSLRWKHMKLLMSKPLVTQTPNGDMQPAADCVLSVCWWSILKTFLLMLQKYRGLFKLLTPFIIIVLGYS